MYICIYYYANIQVLIKSNTIMESKFLNRARIDKIQELRNKLPARCSFAQTISERLENQGIEIPVNKIYAMVRGQRIVDKKVLEEMQKLVQEMEECEASV